MKSSNCLRVLLIVVLVTSMTTIGFPGYLSAQTSTVTFRVEPSVTSGVAPGELVYVDIFMDSPPEAAIIGWKISIKVKPDVLEPGFIYGGDEYIAFSGVAGYTLYEWCIDYPWDPVPGEPPTIFQVGGVNKTEGTITETTDTVKQWTVLPQGVGAGGTGNLQPPGGKLPAKLVTYYFTSKNDTEYSPFEITEAYYYTTLNNPELDKQVPNIIHGHYNTPPPPVVAVDAISAPTTAGAGETVPISVDVSNSGPPVTFTLTVDYEAIIIETRTVSLGYLGAKTELFSWDTTGLAVGNYKITAEAILEGDTNPANNVATTTVELVELPVYRVDLQRHSAWPEHHHHDESKHTMTIKFFAIVRNVGTAPTYCFVKFAIESPPGLPIDTVETDPLELEVGEIYGNLKEPRYYAEWTVPEYDKYWVKATVYFDADGELGTEDWTLSPDTPKRFAFNVVP